MIVGLDEVMIVGLDEVMIADLDEVMIADLDGKISEEHLVDEASIEEHPLAVDEAWIEEHSLAVDEPQQSLVDEPQPFLAVDDPRIEEHSCLADEIVALNCCLVVDWTLIAVELRPDVALSVAFYGGYLVVVDGTLSVVAHCCRVADASVTLFVVRRPVVDATQMIERHCCLDVVAWIEKHCLVAGEEALIALVRSP